MSKIKSQQSTSMHRKVRISDAKRGNRHYRTSSQIVHFATEPMFSGKLTFDKTAGISTDQSNMTAQNNQYSKIESEMNEEFILSETAKQIKEREIKKAFKAAHQDNTKSQKRLKKRPPAEFGLRKAVLALVCTAVIVFGVIYLIDNSSPDVSTKVTAMQNGISAIYPKYIPRGYNSSPVDIISENEKITMEYKNPETGDSFSVIEEFSELTDEEVYENYIKNDSGVEYEKVDGSGMAIYINGGIGAVWKDGNVLMRLKVTSGVLTKKQIITIATTK